MKNKDYNTQNSWPPNYVPTLAGVYALMVLRTIVSIRGRWSLPSSASCGSLNLDWWDYLPHGHGKNAKSVLTPQAHPLQIVKHLIITSLSPRVLDRRLRSGAEGRGKYRQRLEAPGPPIMAVMKWLA